VKILITGGSGMLASELAKQFDAHEVLCCDRSTLDINNQPQVQQVLGDFAADVAIHAAALTDVERCEVEPDLAYQVNAVGTQNIVEAAGSALVVYISSTGNYGRGRLGTPYRELDTPAPTTHYHRSKLLGETFVRQHLPRHLIIRTGWLFGGDPGQKKNFVARRIIDAMSTETMYSDISQQGNPTSTADLARQIQKLIDTESLGTYNCVNAGCATRYEYVREILAAYGSRCSVEPATGDRVFKRIAPVSPNEAAENYLLNLRGLNEMGPWQEALSRYIDSIRTELADRKHHDS
jgi:dTDP-4-dehydrorhamnose reductase